MHTSVEMEIDRIGFDLSDSDDTGKIDRLVGALRFCKSLEVAWFGSLSLGVGFNASRCFVDEPLLGHAGAKGNPPSLQPSVREACVRVSPFVYLCLAAHERARPTQVRFQRNNLFCNCFCDQCCLDHRTYSQKSLVEFEYVVCDCPTLICVL